MALFSIADIANVESGRAHYRVQRSRTELPSVRMAISIKTIREQHGNYQ